MRVKKTGYAKGKKPIKSFDFNAARNNIKDAKQSVQRLAIFRKEVRWFCFFIRLISNNRYH